MEREETLRVRYGLRAPVFVAFVLAVGCGTDPRAATTANFEQALRPMVKQQKLCLAKSKLLYDEPLTLPTRMLPSTIPAGSVVSNGNAESFDATQRAKLKALVAVGLAKHDVTMVEVRPIIPIGNGSKRVMADEYVSAPDFAKYSRSIASDDTSGAVGRLCFASLHLDHVDEFTEPASLLGATISNVSYDVSVADMADWTKSAEMLAAFPTIQQQLDAASTTRRSATVVLMNDGWKAQ